MKREEIAEYRQRLRNILREKDDDKRFEELEQLAKEVGAGYVHQEFGGITTTKTAADETTTFHYHPISESELVLNINNALQTETMIAMCETSTRNFWIALVSVIIAILAMFAAWAAVMVNWRCGR
jgi:hypothetical protein